MTEQSRGHTPSGPEHIALIGGGFTGTSALFQLVDDWPVREITLFEASGQFGPGYPYQPDECPDYLINNTTNTMRLVPGNARGFLDWLEVRSQKHKPDAPALNPSGHLSRSAFGDFLQDAIRTACNMAAIKGIRVNLIPHAATGVHEDEDGHSHITWIDNTGQVRLTKADATILTTGRCPDRDTFARLPAGNGTYFASHIMDNRLDQLPLDATIHVLGNSLSAYDVVNRLFAPATGCRFDRDGKGELVFHPGENGRQVVLCSRSGRMKGVQSPVNPEISRQHFTLARLRDIASREPVTLEAVAQLIKAEADAHGAVIHWDLLADPYSGCDNDKAVTERAAGLLETALRDAREPDRTAFLTALLADAANDIWQAFAEELLPPAEEARYRRDFETATLCFAAPCPIPTAERLLALMRAGRLHIRMGVGTVSVDENGLYQIPHAHGVDTAHVLVNTTGGVNRDVTHPDQPPLIRGMVENGLLQPHNRGHGDLPGAAVDMQTYRAKGSRNIHLANMLLWGPGFFTSSARLMSEIVQQTLQGMYRE